MSGENESVVAQLGEKVQGKNGEVDVSSFSGDKKIVGLYFSAHWCPPCRGFTPKLAEWYEETKKHPKFIGKLEIVFISSDRDKKSFDDYYSEMPWLALPYDDRDKQQKISEKYKVSGIPTLVFLKGNGELGNMDGRNIVMDKDGIARLEKLLD